MKSNGTLDNLGNRATLLPGRYRPLADYFVGSCRVRATRHRGRRDHPAERAGVAAAYPGLNWPEPGQSRWIASNLAPALRAAKLAPKIYGFDHSWAGHGYARRLVSNPAVARAIAASHGIATTATRVR